MTRDDPRSKNSMYVLRHFILRNLRLRGLDPDHVNEILISICISDDQAVDFDSTDMRYLRRLSRLKIIDLVDSEIRVPEGSPALWWTADFMSYQGLN